MRRTRSACARRGPRWPSAARAASTPRPARSRRSCAGGCARRSSPRCARCSTRPGVMLHTNLGRAPLAEAALARVAGRGRGLCESRARPRDRRARLAAGSRRRAGVRADGRRGGDLRQQRRRRARARARGAGRRARDRRLARSARRDRRRLPHPRDRAERRRAAARGRHDQPHAARPTTGARSARRPARCCACTRRTTASSASPASVEVRELAEIAHAASLPLVYDVGSGVAARDSGAGRRAARSRCAARRLRSRLLLGRQAARRPAGRDPRRQRRGHRGLPAPSAGASAAHRQALAGGARGHAARSTATRSGRARSSPRCAPCSSPPRTCAMRAERLAARIGGTRGRDGRARRRRRAAAGASCRRSASAWTATRTCCAARLREGDPPCSRASRTARSCWTAARSATRTRPHQRARMSEAPALTLGTAGHIDHGKTALVRALTGVDTDRLPEEQARGISIALGYASLVAAVRPLALGGRRARARALRAHDDLRRHRHRSRAARRRLRRRRDAADTRARRDPRAARRARGPSWR